MSENYKPQIPNYKQITNSNYQISKQNLLNFCFGYCDFGIVYCILWFLKKDRK